MRRYFRTSICVLVSVFMLCSLCSCGASGNKKNGGATRTIMMYGLGTNLESMFGMLTWNLVQILEADIPEDVNVIIMTGGTNRWRTDPEYLDGAEEIGVDVNNQFWICSGKNAENAENGHGKMTLLEGPEELANVSMIEPETLQGFLDFAAENYPAQMYDLILWDHGGGPRGGFGSDEIFDEEGIETMALSELVSAVKNSKIEHFDIIDFDACLMSNMEVVAALADYTDYVVASPETEPGFGQEYTTWLNALAEQSDMSGFELGKRIVDATVAFYEDENTDGYGEDLTLSVINSKNFKERLVPAFTRMAKIMNLELTQVGNNQLLNFTDEFRMFQMTYHYLDVCLVDLGSFADHLGICMSEIDNYESSAEMDRTIMENAYTKTTQEIEEILADMDGSDDDVIYQKVTEGTTRPVFAEVRYTRNAEGTLEKEVSASPTGLSVYFQPLDPEYTTDYLLKMESTCEVLEDGDIKTMLKEFELANARYLMAATIGVTITRLLEAGETNIHYGKIKEYWHTPRELSEVELMLYTDHMALYEDAPESFTTTEWDAYIGLLMEIIQKNTDDDTDTWLALLTAQQASEAISTDTADAIGIDKNGDGQLDAYRITIRSPLGMIRDVSLKFRAKGLEVSGFFRAAFGDMAILGKVNGEMAMEDFLGDLYGPNETLESGVMAIYERDYVQYDMDASIERWYELVDSQGVGHIMSVGTVDPDHDTEIQIPVAIELQIPDEEFGEETTGVGGHLIYSNGRFVGFSDANSPTPIIPLSNEIFDGAIVTVCQELAIEIPGGMFLLTDPISVDFELPMERTNDRGMSVNLVPVSEIQDLHVGEFVNQPVVTDIYGYEHDLTAVLKAADEKAAAGVYLKTIESAEIKYEKMTYTGAPQTPTFTITYYGQQLIQDQDFDVLVEPETEAGNYRAIIFGKGNYCGYVVTDFTIDKE